MTTTAAEQDDLTPLQMAQHCAAAVLRAADYQDRDPLGAYVGGVGNQAFQSAQIGGHMALVSIAESLDRIADELARARMARNGGHQ